MPPSDHHSPDRPGIDWAAVARTLLVQMLVLIALGAVFVSYLDWSAEQALSDFIDASGVAPLAPYRPSQTRAAVKAVKGEASCKPSEKTP